MLKTNEEIQAENKRIKQAKKFEKKKVSKYNSSRSHLSILLKAEKNLENKKKILHIPANQLITYLKKHGNRVPNGYLIKVEWGKIPYEERKKYAINFDMNPDKKHDYLNLSHINFNGGSVLIKGMDKSDRLVINGTYGIGNMMMKDCKLGKHSAYINNLHINDKLSLVGGGFSHSKFGKRFGLISCNDFECKTSMRFNQIEHLLVRNKTYISTDMVGQIEGNKFLNSYLGEFKGEGKDFMEFVNHNEFKGVYLKNLKEMSKMTDMSLKNLKDKGFSTGDKYSMYADKPDKAVDILKEKTDAILDETDELFNTPKEKLPEEDMKYLDYADKGEKDNDFVFGDVEDYDKFENDQENIETESKEEMEEDEKDTHIVKGSKYEDKSKFKEVNMKNMSVDGMIDNAVALICNVMIGISKLTIMALNKTSDKVVKDRNDVKDNKENNIVDMNKIYEQEMAKENEKKHEDSATNDKSARENTKDLGDTR